MKLLNETQLNYDRGIIQLLHGRLGLDLSSCMAYHTGNFWYIKHLSIKNILIGNYLEILSKYELKGDAAITAQYNVLTIAEIESIIDHCYRLLDKYNTMDSAVAGVYTGTISTESPGYNIFLRPDGTPFETTGGDPFELPS